METHTAISHNQKAFLGLAAIIFIIVVTLFILINQGIQKNNMYGNSAGMPTSTPVPHIGSMSLVQGTNQADNPANPMNSSTVQVNASSDNHTVVGYDVVISYDSKKLTFIGAKSLVGDFTLFPLKGEGYVDITGAKVITSKSDTTLNNTPLVQLTFKRNDNSANTFSIEPKVNRAQTQFVDDKSEILHPDVNTVTIP